MNRIDDGSDAQRIRDMNEADRRREDDDKKRLREKSTERSFSAVIRARRQRQEARRNADRNDRRSAAAGVRAHIRHNAVGRQRDLARRAEIGHALQTKLHARGANAVEDTQTAQTHRTAELATRTIEENAHVRETNREEQRDGDAREEHRAELQRIDRDGGDGGAIDRDGRRNGQDQEHQGSTHEERRTEVAPSGPARAAGGAAPVIPSPLIQRLVSAIYKAATADGRTHLMLELRGGRLEGVRMTVSAAEGRVRCTLSGCDRALAQGLERAEPSLSHGLARRGLQLDALTVERR